MQFDACEGSVGEDLGIASIFLDTVVRQSALAETRGGVRHTLESIIIRRF